MKVLALLLSLLLLTGCASTVAKLDMAEDVIETKLDAAEEAVEQKAETAVIPDAPDAKLTGEDAAAIALAHAGFAAEHVQGLHTMYEIDDGVPEYEVDFRMDKAEYEYTIHAETGEILSFEMDD